MPLIMPAILPGLLLLDPSHLVTAMYAAAVALLVIGVLAARNDVAEARGLDKVVALTNLFFALPLAVFSMEHFFAWRSIMQAVPKFMPEPLFWTFFVGCALLSASLSIATKMLVPWSGLLFGIMMFTFVAMMDLPGALGAPHNRFAWALLSREMSFGAGGWALAAAAMGERPGRKTLTTVGRVVIGIGAVVYGAEHFLHPMNVPGVPLGKLMPDYIPGRMLISYLTGALLVVAGVSFLLAKKARMAATYLGTWISILVFTVYAAILVASFRDPSTDVKVEALNYFTDTMLYGAVILALARAMLHVEERSLPS